MPKGRHLLICSKRHYQRRIFKFFQQIFENAMPLQDGKSTLFQLHYICSPGIAVFDMMIMIWEFTKWCNAPYSRTGDISNQCWINRLFSLIHPNFFLSWFSLKYLPKWCWTIPENVFILMPLPLVWEEMWPMLSLYNLKRVWKFFLLRL